MNKKPTSIRMELTNGKQPLRQQNLLEGYVRQYSIPNGGNYEIDGMMGTLSIFYKNGSLSKFIHPDQNYTISFVPIYPKEAP